MNPLLVYLLLTKATITSFSGLASLAIVREEFVVNRHAITDAQLNTAVAVGRSLPGPNGQYVVGVGYFAAGVPGAIAGTLAMVTPAFLVIPMLIGLARYAETRLVRSVISAVLLAGAGLLIATTFELARSAVTDGFSATVATLSFAVMAASHVDTVWVMAAAALAGLARKALG